jgi:hypothetical protein
MAAPGEKSFCVLEYHTSEFVVTVKRAFRTKYHIHAYKDSPVQIHASTHWKPDRSQHGRPTACYHQPYSSATFVSLCFHSRDEKFSMGFKNTTISFLLLFLNFVRSDIAWLEISLSPDVLVSRHLPWQPSARVSQTSRPSYLSHVITAAT